MLKRVIGLAGVDSRESAQTRKVGFIFDWCMLIIAFWLPMKWYLQWLGAMSSKSLDFSLWLVWVAFIIETVTMTYLVRHKWNYLLSNWLNLLIIIISFPLWLAVFDHMGALRLIRALIIFRIVVPWARSAHHALTLNRIGVTLFIFLITTSLSGLLITSFNTGIKTPFEGIWWAWETVTTVGYGDVVPTTFAGKLLAMIVMLVGIFMVSLLTATISAYFIGKDRDEAIHKRLDSHEEKLIKLIEKFEEAQARKREK